MQDQVQDIKCAKCPKILKQIPGLDRLAVPSSLLCLCVSCRAREWFRDIDCLKHLSSAIITNTSQEINVPALQISRELLASDNDQQEKKELFIADAKEEGIEVNNNAIKTIPFAFQEALAVANILEEKHYAGSIGKPKHKNKFVVVFQKGKEIIALE